MGQMKLQVKIAYKKNAGVEMQHIENHEQRSSEENVRTVF